MGLLKDISDVIVSLKDDYSDLGIKDYANRVKGSSLARSGAEGTLQFPVIISNSLNIETSVMIAKALESQFASFTRITLSMHPYLDLSKDKDITSYLKKFHQNAGSRFNTLGSLLLEGSYDILTNESDEICGLFITSEGCNGRVLKDNKMQMFSVLEYINETALNDLYKPKNPRVNFKNKNLNNYYNNEIVTEANNKKKNNSFNKRSTGSNNIDLRAEERELDRDIKVDQYAYQMYRDEVGDEYKARRDKVNDINNDRNYNLKSDQFKYTKDRNRELDRREQERMNIMNMGNAKVEMTNNDCKKANELVPTTLALSLNVKDKGNFGGTVNFVLGIKAILHPVSSSEVVKNMVYGCKSSNKFFNFIRWTTGEIAFFKDFVLQLDQIKNDAVGSATRKNAWWSALKRRKNVAKFKRLSPISNQLLPNASVVISIEEVNAIRVEHGFDLMDVKMMKKIMNEYFLLSFVIVDNSQELATFLFDGQDEPQTLSFSALERENSNKNDFKEIYKLINSGRL